MTQDELRTYCERHLESIFVRDEIDGRWQTLSLAQLTPERREHWITRWHAEGRTPSRVLP